MVYFGIYYFNHIPFAKIDKKDKQLYKDIKKQLYNIEDEDKKSDVRAYDYDQDGNWDKFEKLS